MAVTDVSSEPSLLQAEKLNLFKPVFTGEALQPLDTFVASFLLSCAGGSRADAALQVGSYKGRAEGQNHPSQLASHASCCAGLVKNEAKDVIFICEFVPDYLGPIEKALPGQLNILGLKRLHKSSVRGRLKCLHKLETKFYLFPHL